jgi:hypothetical protein
MARLAELGVELDVDLDQEPNMTTQEDLDTDGVMMTRPSSMSSESFDVDLQKLRKLALI